MRFPGEPDGQEIAIDPLALGGRVSVVEYSSEGELDAYLARARGVTHLMDLLRFALDGTLSRDTRTMAVSELADAASEQSDIFQDFVDALPERDVRGRLAYDDAVEISRELGCEEQFGRITDHIELPQGPGRGRKLKGKKTSLGRSGTAVAVDHDRVVIGVIAGSTRRASALNSSIAQTLGVGATSASDEQSARLGFQTVRRSYETVAHQGAARVLPGLLALTDRMDGAVVVVPALDGPMPQIKEQLLLAHWGGLRSVVVAMTQTDLVEDEEILELIEMEIRELLFDCGFDGDAAPFTRINGGLQRSNAGDAWDLVRLLDSRILAPNRELGGSVLMPVESTSTVANRKAYVVGRMERGLLRTRDEVSVVGVGVDGEATVNGRVDEISRGDQFVPFARAEDYVTIALGELEGIERIGRGAVIARPNTFHSRSTISADIHILTTTEGGRSPVGVGERLRFSFRTASLSGALYPTGDQALLPGDSSSVIVKLDSAVAMDEGLRFTVQRAEDVVGLGVVSGFD